MFQLCVSWSVSAYASFTMVCPRGACVRACASILSLRSCFGFLQSCMQDSTTVLRERVVAVAGSVARYRVSGT